MSWLSKAAKKVKKAVNKAADKVADVIETAGNKAQEAANGLANSVGNVPFIGPALGAACRWAGAVVCGALDLAGAGVKGIGAAIGGTLAGVLLILDGSFKAGLAEIASGLIGGPLLVVGKVVSLVQIVFGAERRKRRLNEQEVAMLKRVFRRSVALYNIRLIEGRSGVFEFNDRPFTMGNTIYMKRTAPEQWNATLVHETAHVWQYQNLGSGYASDALGAQQYYEHVRDASAYDWWDPAVNNGNMVWEEWNREAQARFIDDVYEFGQASNGNGQWTPVGPWVPGDGQFYAADGSKITGQFMFNPGWEIVAPVAPSAGNPAPNPPGTDYTAVADQAVLALRREGGVRGSLDLM